MPSVLLSSRAGLWDLGRRGVRTLTRGNPGGAARGLGGAAAGTRAAGASGPAGALRPRPPPRTAAPRPAGAARPLAPPAAPAPAPSLGGGPGGSAPPRGGKVGTWRRRTPPGAAGRLLGKVKPGGAGRGEAGAGRALLAVAESPRTPRYKPRRIRRSLASSAGTKPGGSLPAHFALRLVSPLTRGFALFGDFERFVRSVCFSFAL